MQTTLYLKDKPAARWVKMLKSDPELRQQWLATIREFAAALDDSAVNAARQQLIAMCDLDLGYFLELKAVADFLSADVTFLMAGQCLYDASTAGLVDTLCGCTSMASVDQDGVVHHGRLLDWSWPHSIRKTVRLIRVVREDGTEFQAEHIPGLIGFTGAFSVADGYAANLNQAPRGGKLRVGQLPALWWFRRQIETGDLGQDEAAILSDALIHFTNRTHSVRMAIKDGRIFRQVNELEPGLIVTLHNSGIVWGSSPWCAERFARIAASDARPPAMRIDAAACSDTIHRWGVYL